MTHYKLQFKLLSDTTFGRGDGVAGLIDSEVRHSDVGLPYLNGRTLRGLLVAECADILHALDLQNKTSDWPVVAQHLFGNPGSTQQDMAIMSVGDARLPAELRQAIKYIIHNKKVTQQEILESLTAIRRQTAINAQTGTPDKNSLRTMRVILRETVFEADLTFMVEPETKDLALLAACIKALRRAGTGRNRGRGQLEAWLSDANRNDITDSCLVEFKKVVQS